MDEKTKKTLDGILDVYETKQEAAKKETERRKTERELFLDRFSEKARTVIRPHLQQVGTLLKDRGHDFEILEQQEEIERDGKRKTNAGVTLSIFPKGERPQYPNEHGCPRVGFVVSPHSNKIYVHESTMMPNSGGQSGGTGEYDLDAITPAVIDKHIVSVLFRAMGKK